MKFAFKSFPGRYGFVLQVLGKKPLTVLDVGNLGDGESTTTLLQREVEANGGSYVGLDSNEPLTKKLNLPNQKIGDLHKAPFDAETFDAIYAGEIIEHTWTPNIMIGECRRILKPNGLLILDTPNPYSFPNIIRFLFYKEDSMGDNRKLTYHEAKNAFHELKNEGQILLQPQHKIFFTPAMLKQLFETHGFVVESVGVTFKPRNVLHRIALLVFPHSGSHLCIVGRKSGLDEAFSDVHHS